MSFNIKDFNLSFFSLKDKVAVVTGGNTGLGFAFSLALAKAGANVFIPSILEDDGENYSDLFFASALQSKCVKLLFKVPKLDILSQVYHSLMIPMPGGRLAYIWNVGGTSKTETSGEGTVST